MKYKFNRYLTFTMLAGSICLSANVQAAAAEQSQYNMSLQDKVVSGPKGSLTAPQAASAI